MRCPICRQTLAASQATSFKPFCSQRCADLDLGRWLRGAYTVAVTATPDSEDETAAQLADALNEKHDDNNA